ncbi:MAG: hypothetical protein PHC98_09305, partial [Syntrophotalea acetylenica]|nr:hypothetical protein [Syntrophotalea acetylenica]
ALSFLAVHNPQNTTTAALRTSPGASTDKRAVENRHPECGHAAWIHPGVRTTNQDFFAREDTNE